MNEDLQMARKPSKNIFKNAVEELVQQILSSKGVILEPGESSVERVLSNKFKSDEKLKALLKDVTGRTIYKSDGNVKEIGGIGDRAIEALAKLAVHGNIILNKRTSDDGFDINSLETSYNGKPEEMWAVIEAVTPTKKQPVHAEARESDKIIEQIKRRLKRIKDSQEKAKAASGQDKEFYDAWNKELNDSIALIQRNLARAEKLTGPHQEAERLKAINSINREFSISLKTLGQMTSAEISKRQEQRAASDTSAEQASPIWRMPTRAEQLAADNAQTKVFLQAPEAQVNKLKEWRESFKQWRNDWTKNINHRGLAEREKNLLSTKPSASDIAQIQQNLEKINVELRSVESQVKIAQKAFDEINERGKNAERVARGGVSLTYKSPGEANRDMQRLLPEYHKRLNELNELKAQRDQYKNLYNKTNEVLRNNKDILENAKILEGIAQARTLEARIKSLDGKIPKIEHNKLKSDFTELQKSNKGILGGPKSYLAKAKALNDKVAVASSSVVAEIPKAAATQSAPPPRPATKPAVLSAAAIKAQNPGTLDATRLAKEIRGKNLQALTQKVVTQIGEEFRGEMNIQEIANNAVAKNGTIQKWKQDIVILENWSPIEEARKIAVATLEAEIPTLKKEAVRKVKDPAAVREIESNIQKIELTLNKLKLEIEKKPKVNISNLDPKIQEHLTSHLPSGVFFHSKPSAKGTTAQPDPMAAKAHRRPKHH
jgi:hypothetical protein